MHQTQQVYIETYGCQMNVADSEVVAAILKENGYELTSNIKDAEIILINTCSIRDHAEKRIWGKINEYQSLKKYRQDLLIGILGCMAERVQEGFFQNRKVQLVVGPDAYRNLPELIEEARAGQEALDVEFSPNETYTGICPTRLNSSSISGFVPITRGCNNFCSYCIVPFTRGRERSRNPEDILQEVEDLQQKGGKEVTLLGQNVNSYHHNGLFFPELLTMIAKIDSRLRIRFATSHPKDMSDAIIETIANYPNICNHIHLPVQSGSNRILQLMNRKYTREWYLDRIQTIRRLIPDCSITTDVFAGFCSETEQDHNDTLDLMKEVQFDFAFMFKYSERPGTFAQQKLSDNVPEELKTRRLTEIIELQNILSAQSNEKDVGKIYEVLAEDISKKSKTQLFGRTPQNKGVIFPKMNILPGEYVRVKVQSSTSATLIGELV